MSVYSTPALRVGIFRCPPGDALWHETNDNIGDRPHVIFPGHRRRARARRDPPDRDAQRRRHLPPVRDLRALAARRPRRRLPVHRAARSRRAGDAARPRRRAELTEAAKDLLIARLTEPLSLADLARELHVSPSHLTRVFRERTGRTLTEYLHDLRLRAAVDRLGEGSLSRLAADLGSCSPSHFSDRFRAAFGIAASQLRNLMEAEARGGS